MHWLNALHVSSNLIVLIRRFSFINLAAAFHSSLGGEPRRVVNWKAIAIRRAFLSSKVMIDSSESDDSEESMIVASSESDCWAVSEIKNDKESFIVS